MGLRACASARARALSGGQARRLSLAVALAKAPSVVFCDEPTTGLDAAAAAAIMRFLAQAGERTRVFFLLARNVPSA